MSNNSKKSKNSNDKVECRRLKTLLFEKSTTYALVARWLGISENNFTLKINGKRRWWIDECVLVANRLGYKDLKEVFPEIYEKYLLLTSAAD